MLVLVIGITTYPRPNKSVFHLVVFHSEKLVIHSLVIHNTYSHCEI
jgi:hypothetical protein